MPPSRSVENKPSARIARRKKFDNFDLTPSVLLTQLNRLLGLSHGRRLIHPSLDINPTEFLSRPVVAGAKPAFCLICCKEKTKLEDHVRKKELEKILSDPPSDLSTVNSAHIEVRDYLHLCLLQSCPSLPTTRATSVDVSFLCPAQSAQEYLTIRALLAAMEKEGIVLRGVPQAYLDPFVAPVSAPSSLRQ